MWALPEREVKRFSDADARRYLRGLTRDQRTVRLFRDSIRQIEGDLRQTLLREFGPRAKKSLRSPRRTK